MLDKQDLQAISQLLDERFESQDERFNKKLDQKFKENNKLLKDEIVAEIGTAVNAGFNDLEAKICGLQEDVSGLKKDVSGLKKDVGWLKDEMAKRPTRNEIFGWADKRIDELELRADRMDYLHIEDLDKIPPQIEISKTLAARGLKTNIAQYNK
jgi:chromosome segregation ATPase